MNKGERCFLYIKNSGIRDRLSMREKSSILCDWGLLQTVTEADLRVV